MTRASTARRLPAVGVPPTAIRAAAVHQPVSVRTALPQTAALVGPKPTINRRTWRDVSLSLLLAAGLSTAFLGPWQVSHSGSGRILGNTITTPLAVEVVMAQGSVHNRLTVTVETGTLTEALAKAAAAWDGPFTYTSRSQSIYLQQFLTLPNDQTGQWQIAVNGQPVSDLTSRPLLQGDAISLTRITTTL
ncbi:MAG: hypothetical protein HY975_00670 [Candidatus Kerfeldbacteria bacterium]|nr:hypothetical protein [Candidatus Kerfeldbacteria bacterium]